VTYWTRRKAGANSEQTKQIQKVAVEKMDVVIEGLIWKDLRVSVRAPCSLYGRKRGDPTELVDSCSGEVRTYSGEQ